MLNNRNGLIVIKGGKYKRMKIVNKTFNS